MPGSTWIVSFSEEKNLLSQWRGYCPAGGYCLTFKPPKLLELAGRQSFVLTRCTYSRDQQVALVKELIDSAFAAFPAYPATSSGDRVATEDERAVFFSARWFFPKMSRLASAMKDPSFSEEKEWRLIGGLYLPHVTPAYRFKGSLIVPHRVFRIADDDDVIRSTDSIEIGPSQDQDLADLGLFFFKQTVKMDHVRVERSAIPFRQ